jgi:vitamin B12 transporter
MKYFLLFVGAVTCTVQLAAQTPAADSARVFHLHEFLITATRSPLAADDSPVRADILSAEDLQSANGASVADLLALSGDIFVRDQGTTGGLRTVSIRGGAPEHTLILVDGARFNSAQNGLADLTLLPAENIDRIEIVHGGNSALYGADALAGVVNILTKQPPQELSARLVLGAGSFGREEYSAEAGGRMGPLGLLAGLSQERGTDDYTFSPGSGFPRSALSERTDADYRLRHHYLNATVETGGGSELYLRGQQFLADRGTPGPVFDPSTPSLARESDDDILFTAGYRSAVTSDQNISAQADAHYALENYIDPNPAYPLNSFYKNLFFGLNVQSGALVPVFQLITIGFDISEARLESNDFDSRIIRDSRALYLSHEMHWDADRELFDRWSLFESIRYDAISDGEDAVTPRLGMNVRLVKSGDLRLHATIGKSFRSPSFNDLYFRGFSNPSLRAERSTSFDAGISARFDFFGTEKLDVTYFALNTANRILFDPVVFLPMNLGEVQSRGVEVALHANFWQDLLNGSVEYSGTSAKNVSAADPAALGNQIIYQPRDIFSFRASVRYSVVMLGVSHRIVGERYTNTGNSASLPAYRLTGINASLRPLGRQKFGIVFKGEVNNLFNSDYQVFQNYPMPGRSYRFTAGVEL